MISVHLDKETRSAVDLKKAGVHRYAEDNTTWLWGFSYWFVVEGVRWPMRRWYPGDPDPQELLDHIAIGGEVVIHNAAFERTMWNNVLRRRPEYAHWPRMTIEQQNCTMARAAAVAMPQMLDKLGPVLKLANNKDRAGHALMMKMAKPRSFNADGTITWWHEGRGNEANLDILMDYCDQDVRTETDADETLPQLTAQQREMWILDQYINDRGVQIDMRAVNKMVHVVDIAKKEVDNAMRRVTNRAVPRITNVGKLIEWLNGRGIELTSLKKNEQDDVLYFADLRGDAQAREAIELRRAGSKTSTAKYEAMTKCVSLTDGRGRGWLNWHGASTGRRAGRLVQPQNFPRVDPDDEELQQKIRFLHELLADDSVSPKEVFAYIEALYGSYEPMSLMSKALRSCIIAAPGNILVGGDFSNVEGRINAWLAGETWKIEAFRDYDNGVGPDLYKLAYARSFGVDVSTIGKGQKRQIGKVQELALGYQGSIGAFITMGDTYGVNPYDLSGPVQAATPVDQWEITRAKYHAKGTNDYGLQEREWVAIKVIVDNWRAAHPNIVQRWWDYQDAAIEAVAAPGDVIHVASGRISYYCDGASLWCALPSGRMLCYSQPELRETVVKRTNRNGEEYDDVKRTVYFQGVHPKTKQWGERNLYGGLQCENVVQATAVDLLDGAMVRLDRAGFPLVLTVHDEIVAEPTLQQNAQGLDEHRFKDLMAAGEWWAQGLPTAVAAWQDFRYIK